MTIKKINYIIIIAYIVDIIVTIMEKRVVAMNPDIFKFPTTNKTRKNRPDTENAPKIKFKDSLVKKPRDSQTSKTIKRNLLSYIRKHQQERYDEMMAKQKQKTTKPEKNIRPSFSEGGSLEPSDFQESLDYLMKLSKEHPETHNHNRTVRNPTQYGGSKPTNENVNLHLPIEFTQPTQIPLPTPPPPNTSSPVQIHRPLPQPQYGCLKNGSLPTYRTWHNQTQKSREPMPQTDSMDSRQRLLQEKVEELKRRSNINSLASSPIYSSQNGGRAQLQKTQTIYGKKLEKVAQQAKKAAKRIPKQRKTMRRTFRVGRSKVAPKISVLVSNRTIRKNIYTQSLLLKQTPIKEVKQYLIKHGFIRVGSIAPNSILRKMYESAKLMCGEIKNHNPDNLLYNFLNGSKTEEH